MAHDSNYKLLPCKRRLYHGAGCQAPVPDVCWSGTHCHAGYNWVTPMVYQCNPRYSLLDSYSVGTVVYQRYQSYLYIKPGDCEVGSVSWSWALRHIRHVSCYMYASSELRGGPALMYVRGEMRESVNYLILVVQ